MTPPFLLSPLLTLLLWAGSQVSAQCNPTQGKCPAIQAFNTSNYFVDFTQQSSTPSDWIQAEYETVKYGPDGAEFTFAKRFDAPYIWTSQYMLFGRVEIVMQAAPGVGIISSAVLVSDDFDEIDWEFSGNNFADSEGKIQTNYFGKGITGNYDRGTQPYSNTPETQFHTYTLDWSSTQLVWSVDGVNIRTVPYSSASDGSYQYPQTPMRVHLGLWDAGDASSGFDTVEWAGGYTNLSLAPFTAYVKSVKIFNSNPCLRYIYGDTSGTYQSVQCDNSTALVSSTSSGTGITSSYASNLGLPVNPGLATSSISTPSPSPSTIIALTSLPTSVTAGEHYNITWVGGDGKSAVNLILLQGDPADLQVVATITGTGQNGFYLWAVPKVLPTAKNYALQILQGTEVNYSGLFALVGGTSASSTASSASGATTISAVSTSRNQITTKITSQTTSKVTSSSSSGVSTISVSNSRSPTSFMTTIAVSSTISAKILSTTTSMSPSAATSSTTKNSVSSGSINTPSSTANSAPISAPPTPSPPTNSSIAPTASPSPPTSTAQPAAPQPPSSKITSPVITPATTTTTSPALFPSSTLHGHHCNRDPCLVKLLAADPSYTLFCPTYNTAMPIPSQLPECGGVPSRVKSACGCVSSFSAASANASASASASVSSVRSLASMSASLASVSAGQVSGVVTATTMKAQSSGVVSCQCVCPS